METERTEHLVIQRELAEETAGFAQELE